MSAMRSAARASLFHVPVVPSIGDVPRSFQVGHFSFFSGLHEMSVGNSLISALPRSLVAPLDSNAGIISGYLSEQKCPRGV
jgi:hypothetical protein